MENSAIVISLTETEATIRRYLIDSFLGEEQASDFSNQADLFDLLDSLQVLRLVMQIEACFAIKVGDSDLTAENLGSVEKVAAFISRKLQ